MLKSAREYNMKKIRLIPVILIVLSFGAQAQISDYINEPVTGI